MGQSGGLRLQGVSGNFAGRRFPTDKQVRIGRDTAYLVMEYLDGTPLYRIVNDKGRIPAGNLLPRLKPLLVDIGKLHAAGIIHRDISPENLMLEKGEVGLRALLENADVNAVTLSGCDIIVSQPLDVGKPLRVEPGSRLDTTQYVTVRGGGALRVEGELYVNGLLRTEGGGSVSVAPQGTLDGINLLWMEREEDLAKLVNRGGVTVSERWDAGIRILEGGSVSGVPQSLIEP